MKVCLVCAGLPPFYGGAEIRAFHHAQRLGKVEGIETTLIGLHRFKDRVADDRLPSNVRAVRLRFLDSGSTQSPRRFIQLVLHVSEVSLRLGLLLFHLRNRFDVIHVFNPVTWFNLVPIPFARALGKPVIVEMTLRGSDDPLKLSRQGKRTTRPVFGRQPLKYKLFLMADAYVSKSYGLTEAYRQAGLPGSELFQIPSGVDADRFKPPTRQEKDALRRRLSLGREETIVLFVGGVEERKGVHHLLMAFREIAHHHPRARLLIVGPTDRFDQAYVQGLHHDVAEWGLSERVTFVGGLVENVHEYMKAADIFALPSSREGFSMAVLEAMSSGLAIVASDIPEIAGGQIQHDREGLLVPVADPGRLAQSLAELIGDEATRTRLGGTARERVLREFTHEIVDGQYIRLYRELSEALAEGAQG
jgi:glycosyltransferase involved in cell wall biosynthesis